MGGMDGVSGDSRAVELEAVFLFEAAYVRVGELAIEENSETLVFSKLPISIFHMAEDSGIQFGFPVADVNGFATDLR